MVCTIIAYQDIRDRAVLWTLFPILAIGLLGLFSQYVTWGQLLAFAAINALLVSTVLLLLYLYTKFVMERQFLNISFGLGDLLLFYAMAFGFPTISFTIILVGALFFSLSLTLVLGNKKKWATVPLAGLMGIYMAGILLISFSSQVPSLYTF